MYIIDRESCDRKCANPCAWYVSRRDISTIIISSQFYFISILTRSHPNLNPLTLDSIRSDVFQ